jgi:hypothetical protein
MEGRRLQISHQKYMPKIMDLEIPFDCIVPIDPIPGKPRERRQSDGFSKQNPIALHERRGEDPCPIVNRRMLPHCVLVMARLLLFRTTGERHLVQSPIVQGNSIFKSNCTLKSLSIVAVSSSRIPLTLGDSMVERRIFQQ